MGEAKPFETTTISAPHGAPVRVRNRDDGGERGIRTLGGVAPTTVFETAPFNHSGTSPSGGHYLMNVAGGRKLSVDEKGSVGGEDLAGVQDVFRVVGLLEQAHGVDGFSTVFLDEET